MDIATNRAPKLPRVFLLIRRTPRSLNGFEPADHQAIGFTYAVLDRELGWQTFTVGSEFRFQEDPSLWGTLELVRG